MSQIQYLKSLSPLLFLSLSNVNEKCQKSVFCRILWSWPLTSWIWNVIQFSFYLIRHLCEITFLVNEFMIYWQKTFFGMSKWPWPPATNCKSVHSQVKVDICAQWNSPQASWDIMIARVRETGKTSKQKTKSPRWTSVVWRRKDHSVISGKTWVTNQTAPISINPKHVSLYCSDLMQLKVKTIFMSTKCDLTSPQVH